MAKRNMTPQQRKFSNAQKLCWGEGPTSAKAFGKCMKSELLSGRKPKAKRAKSRRRSRR